MQSQNEQVILVDTANRPIGAESKITAHQGSGKLHRAITVFLKDDEGRWLITQRSTKKPLWPLAWDGACSTHQWPGENEFDCATRRLPFEIGISARFTCVLEPYEYHAVYSPEWSENEYNYAVLGITDGEPTLNPDEAVGHIWLTTEEIEREVAQQTREYVPWFAKAFRLIQKNY